MTPVWHIPAGSDWVGAVAITYGGQNVTAYKLGVALMLAGEPTVWSDPVADPTGIAAGRGILVGAGTAHELTSGTWTLWAQLTGFAGITPTIDNLALITVP